MNSQVQLSSAISPVKSAVDTGIKSTLTVYLFHWPLFLIGLLISLACAFAYLQTAKPVYEIKASMLIKDGTKAPNQQSALHEIDLSGTSKIIENEIEVLKSRQLLRMVVNDLQLWAGYQKKDGLVSRELYKSSPVKFTLLIPGGSMDRKSVNIVVKDQKSFFLKLPDGSLKELQFKDRFKNSFGTWRLIPAGNISQYKGEEITISLSDPGLLALEYQKSIDISMSDKLSTAVVLTLEDENEERGKDILNRIFYNYNLIAALQKDKETKKTLDFINQRLASLTDELTQAEKGIETFKSSRGLTDISSESKINLENMQTNDVRLNEVNVQLSVIQGIERYVNSPQNLGKAPATVGIADPALSSLIEKLSELQLQRDKLLATTPETNPDFESINRQIQTTRMAIKESVNNIKTSLLNSRNSLQAFNSHFESSIKNIPAQEREFISIKRQQSIKENLYTYLLQKQEEVSVSYASTLANDQIVDHAYSGPPKEAKKSLAIALALLVGIGFPGGLIYGRNILKGRVTNIQEIKDAVDIPVIAELPLNQSADGIAVNNSRTNAMSEQFRALRSRLYYLNNGVIKGRVILISSSIPGEGKSFVSSNLALAMAYTGKKTVLLELDMRKPKISELFKLSKGKPGISDFLRGAAGQEDIIQVSDLVPDLHIIGCGSEVPNPSELLEYPQLKELIFSLKKTYDDIIIDSPPVRLVPDAMILSRLTDITLYLIRQGFTRKSELGFIQEQHSEKVLTNIHLVFNGIERMKHGYGYDYNNSYYGQDQRKNIFSLAFSDFSSRF